MAIHITDLPLEATEVTLILLLAAGFIAQYRARKRDQFHAQRHLAKANNEIKHLRRMFDKILMVDKGYMRPSDDSGDEEDTGR